MLARSMPPDYRHGRRTRQLLRSLAAVMCPPEAGDLLDPVVEHVELSMGAMPMAVRAALLTGLVTYDLGALARWRRPARVLAPPRAARYLDAWRHGGLVQRELVKAVRGLICLAYYELPEVQERLGYRPGQWIERVKRHRLATYGEDIARHAARLCAPEPLPRLAPRSGPREPGTAHGETLP